MLFIFRNFFKHLRQLFTRPFLFIQIISIIGTCIIVVSGFDWWYFVTMHDHTLYQYLRPALLIGFLMPAILPIATLLYGAFVKRDGVIKVGFALLESAVLGWLVSAFYKSLTGRIQPPHNLTVDTSHQFNFGFMEHGIFWGWPSSHTTVAFATMTALYFVLPKKYKWIGFIGVLYAFYVGIAVSFQIHWFSEFFAGAVFGTLVGYIVSKSYSFAKV